MSATPADPSCRQTNRSMPACSVIPVLAYPDLPAAVDWLGRAFGLVERLRIGDHRAQLVFGDGALVVVAHAQAAPGQGSSLMLRVADIDAHYRRALDAGARVSGPPQRYPYGEAQYSAQDLFGHTWTFSQSIGDVDPADWGGELRRT